MEVEDMFATIVLFIFALIMIAFFILGVSATVEGITQKQVGTKLVRCTDDRGHKFVDELCKEKIMCGYVSNFLKLNGCGGGRT